MSAQRLFGFLILLQAAHSLEEVTLGLYHRLPYFTWIDAEWPGGAAVAFTIVNAAFVLFGAWCYFARVQRRAPNAGAFVVFWGTLEILNGVLHPAWSLTVGEYIPGTATAPLLLVVASLLLWRWTSDKAQPAYPEP